MKWSYRLGEWFGIGVHVHVTFLLLLAWIAFSSGSLASVLFVMALFSFVVMHEYGHALAARHFGIRTRHITLYPIGGVASLEGMPESPRAQALVAIAGPAVNFALAAVLGGVAWMAGVSVLAPPTLSGGFGTLLASMVQANLVLGTFNLLPALPMDGGRIFKALLQMRMGSERATEIAARVARLLAVAMGLFGLLAEPARPMLVVIAAFVWFAAGAETRFARARARVSGEGPFRPSRGWTPPGAGPPPPRAPLDPFDRRYNAFPTDRYRVHTAGGRHGRAREYPPAPRRVRVVLVQGPFGPALRVVPVDSP